METPTVVPTEHQCSHYFTYTLLIKGSMLVGMVLKTCHFVAL